MHVDHLIEALRSPLTRLETARQWGRRLAVPLLAGQRLLVAGNGGSAAEAQHLTAELVGRYVADRPPLSAIALHAETSTPDRHRQRLRSRAKPTPARSRRTGGRETSSCCCRPAAAAATCSPPRNGPGPLGLTVWAMTGPAPNPLADLADDAICVAGADTAVVQEVHLVAIHALAATPSTRRSRR